MSAAKPSSAVALVTGASSGIGKALAEVLAADGFRLVLAARSVAKMEALRADLEPRFRVKVDVVGVDLEVPDGPGKLFDAVKQRGLVLDVLVNNAGYGVFGDFKDTALTNELAMMQLNMSSLVALTKLFLPDLIATKGKILNVASTGSFVPGPNMAVYCATKAFVLSFSEAIAEELAETGVTVTALCPGATASGFQDKAAMQDSAYVKGKRLPTSESVAKFGLEAMKQGRRVAIPGAVNWAMAQSVRFTPRRVVTAIAKRAMQRV